MQEPCGLLEAARQPCILPVFCLLKPSAALDRHCISSFARLRHEPPLAGAQRYRRPRARAMKAAAPLARPVLKASAGRSKAAAAPDPTKQVRVRRRGRPPACSPPPARRHTRASPSGMPVPDPKPFQHGAPHPHWQRPFCEDGTAINLIPPHAAAAMPARARPRSKTGTPPRPGCCCARTWPQTPWSACWRSAGGLNWFGSVAGDTCR